MSVALIVTYIFAILCGLANIVAEYRRVAMMMQQNSYRPERYMRWLRSSGDTTSYARILGMLVFFGSLATFTIPLWGVVLIVVFSAGSAITLFGKKYKKPLVVTARVRRIFGVMALLTLIVSGGVFAWAYFQAGGVLNALFYVAVATVGLYCVSHMIVLAAIWILKPVEARINKGYYDDAARILAGMHGLTVVGITGSYGKTSTKHYLNRILTEHFEVLMTPGSYNTTLGVIRTIREMMKPYTQVFICEMGAKQPNDIKEICDLVHPAVGIVTAVGPQHLESFKTIENVQRTKFELVDALPANGLAVVNNDFPMIASRKVDNVPVVRYGVTNTDARCVAKDIAYGPTGTDFTMVMADGSEHRFHTRLVGECNVSNLLAAIVVAQHLGVPAEKIRRAVDRIEPVEHRLSMKRTPGGITIIDDAFNSNPSGSSMALDVLSGMTGGKRIVITPGMIELGDSQWELNMQFGKKIAETADVAIVVGEYNRDAIVEGIQSVNNPSLRMELVDTFKASQELLATFVAPGDYILYENDLPDTFK